MLGIATISRPTQRQAVLPVFFLFSRIFAVYFGDPCFVIAATSAMRLPKSRAAANSFSSIPGESGPVVALAPNAPPPPVTIIWFTSIASRMANIVSSFPFETAAPVTKAPPTLSHLKVAENAELEEPIVKEGLHLARHVSEINRRSDDDRVGGQQIISC